MHNGKVLISNFDGLPWSFCSCFEKSHLNFASQILISLTQHNSFLKSWTSVKSVHVKILSFFIFLRFFHGMPYFSLFFKIFIFGFKVTNFNTVRLDWDWCWVRDVKIWYQISVPFLVSCIIEQDSYVILSAKCFGAIHNFKKNQWGHP